VTDAAESQHTLAVRKLQALTVRKKSHFLSDVAIYQHRPTTRICRQHTAVTLHFYTSYNAGKKLHHACVSAMRASENRASAVWVRHLCHRTMLTVQCQFSQYLLQIGHVANTNIQKGQSHSTSRF